MWHPVELFSFFFFFFLEVNYHPETTGQSSVMFIDDFDPVAIKQFP